MTLPQVTAARALINVPWRHQGRNPAVGIDCVGLLALAFGEPVPNDYTREPHSDLISKRLHDYFGNPVTDEIRVGDAVALGGASKGPIRHVAIIGDYIYGGLSIIHTDSIVGKVTEHPLDERWRNRIREVYRQ